MPRRILASLAAFALVVVFISAPAVAHTPVMEAAQARPGQSIAPERAVEIHDLGESTAFYGWISHPGNAGVYAFEVSKPLRLKASLLVPVLLGDAFRGYRPELILVGPGVRGTYAGFPFRLSAGSGVAVRRSRFEPVFHEPFSHTDYHQGPKLERDLGPGRYFLLVYSAADNGPYCLVTGTEERLFRIIAQTLRNREKLEHIFFAVGTTPLRSPFGLSAYHWLLLASLGLVILVWLTAFRIGSVRRRVAIAIFNALSLIVLALTLLEIRISVLPEWVFWATCGAAAIHISGPVFGRNWLRGLAAASLAVILAVCIA